MFSKQPKKSPNILATLVRKFCCKIAQFGHTDEKCCRIVGIAFPRHSSLNEPERDVQFNG